jgi:protein MAK11
MSFAIGTYEGVVYGLGIVATPDGQTLKVKFVSEPHISTVKAVAHSVGHWMVSGGADESIRIYNTETMREFGALLKHQGTITSLKFFQDAFMLSAAEDGLIYVWSTEKWECVATLKGHKGAVRDLSIHPSGRVALSVGADGAIRMWDLTAFKPALVQTTESKNLSLVEWSPTGESYIVLANGAVGEATINVHEADGTLSRRISVNARVFCLTFVTATWLAIGGEDGVVSIFDIKTGSTVHTLKGHEKRIRGLAPFFMENELPLLASASSDGVVNLWRLDTPQTPLATFVNPTSRITTLCSFRPLATKFEQPHQVVASSSKSKNQAALPSKRPAPILKTKRPAPILKTKATRKFAGKRPRQ